MRFLFASVSLALLLALSPPWGAAAAPAAAARLDPAATTEAQRAELHQLLEGGAPLLVEGHPVDLDALRRLYQAHDLALIWAGHEERAAALAAALIVAGDDGLDLAMPAPNGGAGKASGPVERDLWLSDTALRLATALATGRTRPEQYEEDWAVAAPSFDAPTAFAHALDGERLGSWFASLAPSHQRYLGLKAALVHYRELARGGNWPKIPNGPTLKPGMADDRVAAVRRRLAAEGYLSPDSDGGNEFDSTLEAAIRAYQARNGIVVDGSVGQRTLNAMNVPIRARIEQIVLNLERWRGTPRDFGKSYILVNVPGESLEVIDDGMPVMSMNVVVGDPGHPTPVVESRISAVTFNPPWRIPLSIARKEIVPKIKADANFLDKNQMIMKGAYLFEQLPGPKNPLGRIKLEMPNKFDVYLHDTPTHATFERAARALSHGCVRMAGARELAAYVLDPVKWTPDDIARVINAGETQHVGVMRRLRVAILYFTSFVDGDGAVEFRDDLYGRDKRLRAALQADFPGGVIKSAQASP